MGFFEAHSFVAANGEIETSFISCYLQKKRPECSGRFNLFLFCREEGIRTPDTLPYTRFPSVLLKPLGHLSIGAAKLK